MHVTLYMEQVVAMPDTHYERLNTAEFDNKQAIDEWNVDNVKYPGRKEAMPYTAAARTMSEIDLALLTTLPNFQPWQLRTQLPGIVSVNREDQTVNVYVTQRDFVTGNAQKMKFGKYLRKLGDRYDDTGINILAAELKTLILLTEVAELSYAHGSDDIVDVYENGPNSCMGGCASGFDGQVHPAAVYGTADICCAYVDLDGRYVARALINVQEKQYSETYGNDALIIPLLKKAGYTKGDLTGCTLKKIDNLGDLGGFIMPYIDGEDYVTDWGDYFEIDGGGDTYCGNTNGLSTEGDYCEYCEATTPDAYYIEDVGHVCDHDCAAALHYVIPADAEYGDFEHTDNLYFCETDSRWYSETDNLVLVNDEWYKDDDDEVVFCEQEDEHFFREDCVYIEHRDLWVLDENVAEYDDDYRTA